MADEVEVTDVSDRQMPQRKYGPRAAGLLPRSCAYQPAYRPDYQPDSRSGVEPILWIDRSAPLNSSSWSSRRPMVAFRVP